MVFIFFYILVYVIFYTQGFRKPTPVAGVASLTADRDDLLAYDDDIIEEFCLLDIGNSTKFLNSFWPGNGGWSVRGMRTDGGAAPGSGGQAGGGKAPAATDGGTAGGANTGTAKPPRKKPPKSKGDVPDTVRWGLLTGFEEDDDVGKKLPCFFVPADMVTVYVPPQGVFVATKRNTTVVEWTDTVTTCSPYDPECPPQSTLKSSMFLPYSTLQLFRLQHTVRSGTWLEVMGDDMVGALTSKVKGVRTTKVLGGDLELSIGDMIFHAGLETVFDEESGHHQPTVEQRNNGGIIMATILYQNGVGCHSLWWCWPGENDVQYTISFSVLANSYELAHRSQPVATAITGTTWVTQYHLELDTGWMVLVVQEYAVGVFDFSTFFLNLCAALGFLSVIKACIDFLALYLLADKEFYRKLLILESTDKDTWHSRNAESGTNGKSSKVAPESTVVNIRTSTTSLEDVPSDACRCK
eukprot:TRINITY_DN20040_c0_g1_i1.p1 TRINITY_DN20040_c0_g1~~TRINITY_DN20040_c0_g1_i1.p1  ORF type:complete len:515 (-),score=77.01 TRINITY_DN20040_c0_g1_i1:354-1754(-)